MRKEQIQKLSDQAGISLNRSKSANGMSCLTNKKAVAREKKEKTIKNRKTM